ncbi:helix-turn-helix transcriptional regulator [Rouxiella badensis]|uniref:AraC family transcriptional regulator n=1 Tax=Rouxiella badensis TaxID=1646377 RepID=UPI00301E12AB
MHDKINGDSIPALSYAPKNHAFLDLEIFRMSELRARVHPDLLSGSRRYFFYMMLLITNGTVRQRVDGRLIDCGPGTVIIIKPGQVHHLGNGKEWDGWLMLFRPEILPPQLKILRDDLSVGLDRLDILSLAGDDFCTIERSVLQMCFDIDKNPDRVSLNQLLYYQLGAIITRLKILSEQIEEIPSESSLVCQRFMKFTYLLEEHFKNWHQVNQYAKAMNCSGRSLTRSTLALAGCNAKSYICERIALEAKRLLTHTPYSVVGISQQLGFDEPTHFVKFFKSVVGISPASFRDSLSKDLSAY